MGTLGLVLILLAQFWAPQGATGLRVQQAPKWLQARQDSQVTLVCQVGQAQAWEQLRVEWTKDGDTLCQTQVTNVSLSMGVCGPRGWLSWQPPGNLTLQLDPVSFNDSGLYVCWATVEIPGLEEAQGNGTQLLVETGGSLQNPGFSGLFFALLVTATVAVAAFALGAWVWGRRCRRRWEAGNPLYSNVLYRPQRAPRKSEAWPVEEKAPLDSQKGSLKREEESEPPETQRSPPPSSYVKM